MSDWILALPSIVFIIGWYINHMIEIRFRKKIGDLT